MTVDEATNVELDYEYFMERYKERQTTWAKLCKVSFVLSLGLAPFVYDYFANMIGGDDILTLLVLVTASVLVVAGVWELAINVIERILSRSYLKSYMTIEENDCVIVHGYIRDADRPKFQLSLRRQYPGYELDMDLAARRRCAYVLVKRKSVPMPELPVNFS